MFSCQQGQCGEIEKEKKKINKGGPKSGLLETAQTVFARRRRQEKGCTAAPLYFGSSAKRCR